MEPTTPNLEQVRALVRRVREMLNHVNNPLEAVGLVRQSSASEKVVVEALKVYHGIESEQFQIKQEAGGAPPDRATGRRAAARVDEKR
jgi:predicted CoA-binding protein